MQTMREAWTDERLDDLNHRVSEGFTRVGGDLREIRTDVKDLRREMNDRFDRMHQRMIRGFVAMAGITVTCFVGLAGLIAL